MFLEDLKFGIGDGNLHYYLYNFKCPELTPEQVSARGCQCKLVSMYDGWSSGTREDSCILI